MTAFQTILCDGEFEKVSVLDKSDIAAVENDILEQNKRQQLQAELSQGCDTISSVVSQVQKLSADIVKEYKKQIVALSVQIAEKILAVNIKQDNYDIAEVITAALDCVPKTEDITVYLSSDDFERVGELEKQGKLKGISGLQFKADGGIKNAECRIASPKGIVNSIIQDHLENINRALEQVV